jgi:hypothetical protein
MQPEQPTTSTATVMSDMDLHVRNIILLEMFHVITIHELHKAVPEC